MPRFYGLSVGFVYPDAGYTLCLEDALHMPDFCGYVYENSRGKYTSAGVRLADPPLGYNKWGKMAPAAVPVGVLFRKRADG